MQKEIKISTDEEFVAFINSIDNEKFLEDSIISASKLSVSFKIEGDRFNSSLTGTFITALAAYQEKIYHIYKTQKYGEASHRQLTDEEKRALEIKVVIKPGCTEAVIEFVKDIIPEVVSRMDGAQITKASIAVAGIVAGAWAIKGIAVPAIKEAFKTKRAEIDSKVEIAKDEKEKAYLESIASITHDAIEGMRSVASGIATAAPEKISVDGQQLDNTKMALLSDDMVKKVEKTVDNKPDVYNVSGMFQVLEINYEKDNTTMKAKNVESGTIYEDINLLDGWMSKENMTILENAQLREPVFFRIICEKAGRKYKNSIDVHSINEIHTDTNT